jgi:MarR family transcriptional regulator, organic hydroperoxide resistance regulator
MFIVKCETTETMSKPVPKPAATTKPLSLSQHMCFALYSASLTMTKVYQPFLKLLKLTYPQYLVLLVLWEKNVRKVSEIGQVLYLDSGTLTPILKKLEALGYVERRRCETDERCVWIHLTAAGRAVQKKSQAVPACVIDACGCGPKELTDLNARLKSLRESLHKAL